MKKKIEEILIELGVYPNLSGFNYICKAIDYISKNSGARICAVYSLVADDFNTTSSRVERAIRHALSKADKDSDAYKKYMSVKDTTNSTVLYTMAVRLRED